MAKSYSDNSSDDNHYKEFLEHKISIENSEDLDDLATPDDECILNSEISIEELKSALTLSKNTSPGPDTIPNILIKQLSLRHLILY